MVIGTHPREIVHRIGEAGKPLADGRIVRGVMERDRPDLFPHREQTRSKPVNPRQGPYE